MGEIRRKAKLTTSLEHSGEWVAREYTAPGLSPWSLSDAMRELQAAKEVSGIKKEILKNGFQPIEQHVDAMGQKLENSSLTPFIPMHLMTCRLQPHYNPELAWNIAVEFARPWLEHKELDPNSAGIFYLHHKDGQWLIMPMAVADEVMKNLKAERTVSSCSHASLQ